MRLAATPGPVLINQENTDITRGKPRLCCLMPVAHSFIVALSITRALCMHPNRHVPNSWKLCRHGHIVVGDFFHEFHTRIVQHDVEVLDGMHALQALPVLEPGKLPGLEPASERPLNIRVDLAARLGRRQARRCVVFELELGPDDEVHNLVVDSIGPVVVQDLDVLFAMSA
jgi:hypothetical protein